MSGRFIGFARVSSDIQRREGYSIEVQVERLETHAKKLGGALVKTWKVAETASVANARSEFKSAMAFAADPGNRITAVLFDRIDRAFRNPRDMGEIAGFVEDNGIHCHFITEGLTTRDEDWFMVMIHGAVAYQAVNVLKSKVIAAQLKRVESGLFHSSAPFGYENYREGNRSLVRVVRAEAEAVRFMFDKYAWSGYTLDRIVTELNEHGYRWSKKKPDFNRATVYKILLSRSYLGEVKFKNTWSKGSHPALVDLATFDRVGTLLGKKKYEHHALLFGTGMLKCGTCDHAVTGYPASKYRGTDRESEFTYYICGTCRREKRPFKPVKQPHLESQVKALFVRMQTQDEEIRLWFIQALAVQARKGSDAKAAEIKRMEQAIASVDTKERKLLELYYGEGITIQGFKARQTEMRDERTRLEDSLALVRREGDEETDDAVLAFELANSLEKRWDSADIQSRRILLDVICSNWTLNGVTLVPTMRKPFDALVEGPLNSTGRTDKIRTCDLYHPKVAL